MKAVFFDMGDTLLHGFHDGSISALCRTVGKERPEFQPLLAEVANRFEVVRAENLATYAQPQSFDDIFLETWRPQRSQYPKGATLLYELFDRFIENTAIFPETKEALDALAKRGCRLALVSNISFSPHHFQPVFVRFGIRWRFEEITFSTQAMIRKPHPEIFHKTLRAMALEPEDALMVGDQIAKDVVGAHAVGIKAVWINRTKQRRRRGEEKPDWTIKDLRELLPILESLL